MRHHLDINELVTPDGIAVYSWRCVCGRRGIADVEADAGCESAPSWRRTTGVRSATQLRIVATNPRSRR